MNPRNLTTTIRRNCIPPFRRALSAFYGNPNPRLSCHYDCLLPCTGGELNLGFRLKVALDGFHLGLRGFHSSLFFLGIYGVAWDWRPCKGLFGMLPETVRAPYKLIEINVQSHLPHRSRNSCLAREALQEFHVLQSLLDRSRSSNM